MATYIKSFHITLSYHTHTILSPLRLVLSFMDFDFAWLLLDILQSIVKVTLESPSFIGKLCTLLFKFILRDILKLWIDYHLCFLIIAWDEESQWILTFINHFLLHVAFQFLLILPQIQSHDIQILPSPHIHFHIAFFCVLTLASTLWVVNNIGILGIFAVFLPLREMPLFFTIW